MRDVLKNILKVLAKLTLWRYRPRVVVITGSVGKTTTKAAVAAVLSSKFSVRATPGNYNNEIGVPLTIIGEESGQKNPVFWVWIFAKALVKFVATSYPEILVLEMGTDRPGDIAYLVDLVGAIDTAILTDIGISHLEFFAHPQDLAKEKLSLIKKLPSTSLAILNFDNEKIQEGKNSTKAEIVGFGFNQQANLVISDFQVIDVDAQIGANFKTHNQGNVVPFFLPNALGKPQALAAAAASAVGLRFGINLVTSSQALKKFQPPAGRLRLIAGKNQTNIIDDTYNAAPDSTLAALETLSNIAKGRKLAVIGDMAELGSKTESGHREIGAKIVENQIDLVFLVGEKTKFIQDELNKRKFIGRVVWFATADECKATVDQALIHGDTVLVKGSQAARMEKIVKQIMTDPDQANHLLVRQSNKWMNQP